MSFPVAVRSAIFYILACTPCAKVRHHHKARETAKREREEKERMEAGQPGLYRHPSPYHTNPFWQEEITMGPSLPPRSRKASGGGGGKNSGRRRLGDGSSGSGKGSLTTSAPTPSSVETDLLHCTTPIHADSSKTSITRSHVPGEEGGDEDRQEDEECEKPGEDWNKTRYQREEEELWGQWPGHRLVDAIVKAGSSAGRFVEAKLGIDKSPSVTPDDRHNFYYPHRNPPVNEYHPPVVSSRPAHPDAHKWMLQPPPPAKVMEGKCPVVVRRHAGSLGSSFSGGSTSGSIGSNGSGGRNPLPAPDGYLPWAAAADALTEQELIESLIGKPAPPCSLSGRSRSFSVDSTSSYDSGGDHRLRGHHHRRRHHHRFLSERAAPADSDDESNDGSDGTDDDAKLALPIAPPPPPPPPPAALTKGRRQPPQGMGVSSPNGPGVILHAAKRPKLETIMSSRLGSASLLMPKAPAVPAIALRSC